MKPILIVIESFQNYRPGQIIDDPEAMREILASQDASKVKRTEMRTGGEAEIWLRQKTIDDAVAGSLADGVFKIIFYNSQHTRGAPEKQIDPFQVFASVPRADLEDWIERSKKLTSSNYDVGDALVGNSDNYESIKNKFVSSNPGFGQETYSHAIQLGASKAVH